jgi:hypothetical protein
MTSRLRRGLDELEQSGRNLNESFCQVPMSFEAMCDVLWDKTTLIGGGSVADRNAAAAIGRYEEGSRRVRADLEAGGEASLVWTW